MIPAQQVEDLITLVSGLDRNSLLRQFQEYPASFPLDFTPDFLSHQPLERLQHLFVAVCMQSKKVPLGVDGVAEVD
jgi:hypothetical protein